MEDRDLRSKSAGQVEDSQASVGREPGDQEDCDTSCSSITHSVPEDRGRLIRTTVNRTDSVKTQSSLKLIHEKMSLLANLQEKADQCRYLESQLDSLDDKMSCVAKSR